MTDGGQPQHCLLLVVTACKRHQTLAHRHLEGCCSCLSRCSRMRLFWPRDHGGGGAGAPSRAVVRRMTSMNNRAVGHRTTGQPFGYTSEYRPKVRRP